VQKLLSLPGYSIQRVDAVGERLIVFACSRARSAACPCCGHISARIHSYRQRRDSRERHHECFRQVRERYARGDSLLRISREPGMSRTTVMKYAYSESFPERAQRQPGASILDPYLPYLAARHQQGCENASLLWREIKARGFAGSRGRVLVWMKSRRRAPACNTPTKHLEAALARVVSTEATPTAMASPKALARWLVQLPTSLAFSEETLLKRVAQDPETAKVLRLAREFAAMLRAKDERVLPNWLDAASRSGIRTLETFAESLRRDEAAIRAALSSPWSNAQAEGQISKLKMIKPTMYGRAKFDLLCRRVLLA
jgi:transposase